MVSNEKLNAAVEFFTENNDFYKEKYENAPSEECKKKIALGFYFSTFWDDAHEDEDFFRLSDEIDDKLTLEDWEYLLKYQGNNPGRAKIKQRIRELSE